MKQAHSLKSLVIHLVMLLLTAGCATQTSVTSETVVSAPPAALVTAAPAATMEPGCATASGAAAARCRQMEAEMLAATVRLALRIYARNENGVYVLEDGNIGHATVVAGRYLLTHNHYALSLADFQDGRRRTVTVFRPDGEVALQDAPFGAFDVVMAAPQLLVFDFRDYGGQGLFAAMGIRSAPFDPRQAARLRPGMEVAQVNWDGATARVDWVRVLDIRDEQGAPVLVLDNFVRQGASGGGVFYHGVHLANNWYRRTVEGAGGRVLDQTTVAALNQGVDLAATAGAESAPAGATATIAGPAGTPG